MKTGTGKQDISTLWRTQHSLPFVVRLLSVYWLPSKNHQTIQKWTTKFTSARPDKKVTMWSAIKMFTILYLKSEFHLYRAVFSQNRRLFKILFDRLWFAEMVIYWRTGIYDDITRRNENEKTRLWAEWDVSSFISQNRVKINKKHQLLEQLQWMLSNTDKYIAESRCSTKLDDLNELHEYTRLKIEFHAIKHHSE